MKTMMNAYNLFKKQLSSNIIIILFTSLFCVISIYLYNQYEQRVASYTMFNNSNYNILYANLPNDYLFNPNQVEYAKINNNLQSKVKNIKGYEGTSFIIQTYVQLDKGQACAMYMIDPITSKALKYRLIQGEWLSDTNIVNGIQPCIIGGTSSNNYRIGDILNISFMKSSYKNGDYANPEIKQTNMKYYIAGKFYNKQQFFNINLSSASSPQPLGEYFKTINSNLYIWAQQNYTLDNLDSIMDFSMNSNPLLYFNKSLSRENINQIIKKIDNMRLFTHLDLMAEEKTKIKEDYSFILPIITMTAIVSIIGIYSMCVLNVLRNQKDLAIFYLCGCSKGRSIMIMTVYSLFFMFHILIVIALIFCLFTYVIHIKDPYISQFIYLNFRSILIVVSFCFFVSLISSLTPFAVLKKMSIVKQLNQE